MVVYRLFNQIAIRPATRGEKGDREVADTTVMEGVVDPTLAMPPFAGPVAREDAIVRRPFTDQRGALKAAGASSNAKSVGAATARRGIMAV